MMKLIILDRDGVINYDSAEYIKHPDEWQPIPGSLEAIARLKRHGFRVAVATNQSGIARGYYDIATLDAIHAKMQTALAAHGASIDHIAYCPHLPDAGCDCRKPQSGLLLQISQQFNCPLADVPFVGDRQTDIRAALAVQANPIYIHQTKAPAPYAHIETYPSLLAYVDVLCD